MAKLDEFLLRMIKQEASDLHLTVGYPPMVRVHGKMKPLSDKLVTQEINQQLLSEIMSPTVAKQLQENLEVDFGYEISQGERFRVNVFHQKKGLGSVFRLISSTVPTLRDLGMPPIVRKLAESKQGLVLVTGATGSGKSTTLAAMINHINETRAEHILTIEDPIEYVHPSKKALINYREVGTHTRSFANAMRSALREDPDVILLGEMRDLETIELALNAAETGHLVLATLHTSSAARTINRVVNVFPPHQQGQIRHMLSESLVGVICQNLLRRIDKPGRVAAIEIMVVVDAVSNLIREEKAFQIPSVIQTGKKHGMQTMDQALWDLYMKKVISAEDAYRIAENKRQFEQHVDPSKR